MKKNVLLFLSSLLFLFSACSETDGLLAPESDDAYISLRGEQITKPFKATFQFMRGGTRNGTCELNGLRGFLVADGPGEGNATHMGKVRYSMTTCFRPYIPPFGGPGGPVPGEFESEGTITAANGDQVFISISWQSYPNPDDSSLADLIGSYTITGGNGKFENASGEGEISGVADADPFNPRFYPYGELQGTIAY